MDSTLLLCTAEATLRVGRGYITSLATTLARSKYSRLYIGTIKPVSGLSRAILPVSPSIEQTVSFIFMCGA